jgi:hypothetical protein
MAYKPEKMHLIVLFCPTNMTSAAGVDQSKRGASIGGVSPADVKHCRPNRIIWTRSSTSFHNRENPSHNTCLKDCYFFEQLLGDEYF